MRRPLLIIVLVLTCANAAELRSRAPVLSASTDKSVQAVSECISGEWSKNRLASSSLPISSGVSLALTDHYFSTPMVAVLADITATDGKTTVKVFTKKAYKGRKWRGDIEHCF